MSETRRLSVPLPFRDQIRQDMLAQLIRSGLGCLDAALIVYRTKQYVDGFANGEIYRRNR